MRILITGGAGFIGSHLAGRMVEAGASLVILDDLSTGAVGNVAHLLGRPDVELVRGTVTDRPLVAALVRSCDVVAHLAAVVGVGLVARNVARTLSTNVGGTRAVLDAAAAWRRLVVLASTSEVYDPSGDGPCREDEGVAVAPTPHGRSAYGRSKALGERLALAYRRDRGLRVVVVRLFNTVGPRQSHRHGMVLPTFARQAVLGQPLTVFGSGRQTRCFNHVRDTVEAIARLIDSPHAVGEVFNVGADREVSIGQLARLVRDAAGSTSAITSAPYPEGCRGGAPDPVRRAPDLSKLRRAIGYRPIDSLEGAIAAVVAEQRALLGAVGGVAAS